MKKLILFAVFGIFSLTMFSQAPQSFNYQLIARDTSGKILANRTLGIQISILTDSNNGIVVYGERHTAATNNFGMVNLAIGTGTVTVGSFQPIEWGLHLHYIKLDIDPAGGSNYFTLGTSQLVSVPYALYAEKAGNIKDTSATNELQALSISNDTIYLSNGGFVKLPPSTPQNWTTNGLNISNNNSGFVGIGTSEPTSALHVNGSVRITDESEGTGKVLTSDIDGNASWQNPALGNSTGTANYVPKFNGANSLGNSVVYQSGNNLGIGTTAPFGRLVVQGDSLANDSLPLFEVKDKKGNTVFVIWPNGAQLFVDTAASVGKAQNKGSFAVSGKSTAKNASNDIMVIKPNDIQIFLDDAIAGKAQNKGSFAVSGKSTAKNSTSNILTVQPNDVHVYLDDAVAGKAQNKGSFAVSGKSTAKNATSDILTVSPNDVHVYLDDAVAGKAQNKGSFAVSGKSTARLFDFFSVNSDSVMVANSLIIPRLTTGQRDSLGYNASDAQIIFNLTDRCMQIFENASWSNIWCLHCAASIITQPNSATICSSADTSFEVSSTGTGLLYQWQVSTDNGSTWNNITEGGTNPAYSGVAFWKLSLSNVPLSCNSNKYRCYINANCPPGIYSNEVTLNVGSTPPVITQQPVNGKTWELTSTVTFNITSSGYGVVYQWQQSTDGISWNNINEGGTSPVFSGTTSANLSLSNVPITNNNYKYRCNIGNNCGATIISDEVILTVSNCTSVTDIDNNIYNVVKIGEQCWMKENLKTTKYRDNTPITNVTDDITWTELTTGAYCNYENQAGYANTYGRYYNGYTIDNSSGLCPTGWHIPSNIEWTQLSDFLGGSNVAGGKMKNPADWTGPYTGITNSSGFSAKGAGFRWGDDGIFQAMANYTYFWSSTSNLDTKYVRMLEFGTLNLNLFTSNNKAGFSIRCLKDF